MKTSTITPLKRPAAAPPLAPNDPLTELLRDGARKLIAQAVEAELEHFLTLHSHLRTDEGLKAVVRNGYLPERELNTGIGQVAVRIPKVRDRRGQGLRFNSMLVPPYLKKTKSVDALLPWLYLKGVSTQDFREALVAILGPSAKGLSPSTIARAKEGWEDELKQWSSSSLAGKRYVYWWADGVYFNIRGEDARSCILVIIGVTETGHKELVAVDEGFRESEQSWTEVLQGLKARGLEKGPLLGIGDGSLGFWKALLKVFSDTRQQRCWVHKTANVLNKLPKSSQQTAKAMLQEIWMAESKEKAQKAFDRFLETYKDKYPKAADCLSKDREALLAFYDFPAAHWQHIRTTNPVESTFATVRLRTAKTRGCVSRTTILTMVFKLGMSAQRRWRRLKGFEQLAKVITGVKFRDGVEDIPIQKPTKKAKGQAA